MAETAPAVRQKHQFVALDQLRGLLCLLVVAWHANFGLGWGLDQRSFPLAVDVFFILSGFVVAEAYLGKMRAGALEARTFALIRLVRFYPLLLLGLALGGVRFLGDELFGDASDGFGAWLKMAPQLFFLPVAPSTDNVLFPFNPPAWSLWAELLINVAFALTWRRMSIPVLALVAAVGAVGVAASSAAYHGLDAGWGWSSLPALFARVMFGFPLGVLLHRLHERGFHAPRVSGLALTASLALIMLAVQTSGAARTIYEAAFVLIGAPLFVWLGISARNGKAGIWLGRASARLSFAVYAIHYPLLLILSAVNAKAVRIYTGQPVLDALILFAIVLAAAWVADAWFDRPLGRFLSQNLALLRPRPGVDAAQAAR